uniref:(California timema) hypothetical protein n=1 Tax=Timema californicum TaxID=61474 RepID=A0A7R9J6H7_TIMCA|nr:unnamed protein product [Timema californicum]
MCVFAQKSSAPSLEQLACPQFENEAKRTAVKVTKQTTVPAVEGTSVTPRQRPKGAQPHPTGVLPIPIPSPVPHMGGPARRQVLPPLSQSPNTVNGTFGEPTPSLPGPGVPSTVAFPLSPSLFPSPPATVAAPAPGFESRLPTNTPPPSCTALDKIENNSLETHFPVSGFPDPFRDDSTAIPLGPKTDPPQSVSQCLANATPPSSPTLAPSRSHHRRNMSDTSAFNKVFASETSQFLAPYEASVKSRSGSNSPPEGHGNNSASRSTNIPDTHNRHLMGVSVSQLADQPPTKPRQTKIHQPPTKPRQAKIHQPPTKPRQTKIHQPPTKPRQTKIHQPPTKPRQTKIHQPPTKPRQTKIHQPPTKPRQTKIHQPPTKPRQTKIHQPPTKPRQTKIHQPPTKPRQTKIHQPPTKPRQTKIHQPPTKPRQTKIHQPPTKPRQTKIHQPPTKPRQTKIHQPPTKPRQTKIHQPPTKLRQTKIHQPPTKPRQTKIHQPPTSFNSRLAQKTTVVTSPTSQEHSDD